MCNSSATHRWINDAKINIIPSPTIPQTSNGHPHIECCLPPVTRHTCVFLMSFYVFCEILKKCKKCNIPAKNFQRKYVIFGAGSPRRKSEKQISLFALVNPHRKSHIVADFLLPKIRNYFSFFVKFSQENHRFLPKNY